MLHVSVALIGIAMLCGAAAGTLWLRDETLVLARTGEPTARAAALALHGLERSIAALRGRLLSDDVGFERERARAWALEIVPALSVLEAASVEWADPHERRRLLKLEGVLRAYRAAQDAVERRVRTGPRFAAEEVRAETAPLRRRATVLLTAFSERQHARLSLAASRLVRTSDAAITLVLAMIPP